MEERSKDKAEQDRRAFLGTFGKAAIVAPPVITTLLSTSMASPAIAASTGGGGGGNQTHGNNGVGNGQDPQPPGNPPINDGPGTGPGNPGNKHHGNITMNMGVQAAGHGHHH